MGTNHRRLPQRVRADPDDASRIAGDAPAEKLREVVQRGTDRSVVFDIDHQRRARQRRRRHRLTPPPRTDS